MTSRMRGALALVALLVGGSAVAEAQQGPSYFGPRAGFHFDGSDFGIGAHFIKPITDAISIYPSFNYWFVGEGVTSWSVNADLLYQMPSASLEWLSLGAGLGYWKTSFDCGGFDDVFGIDCSGSSVGVNLLGHVQPPGDSRIKPFGELRLWLGDGSGLSVAGGIKIPLGN